MGDIIGTPKKVTFDGTPFDVMADANFTLNLSKFDVEGVPTSGRTLKKMVARVQGAESVTIATNEAEDDLLKELSDRTDKYPVSFQLASGAIYRATGFIKYENRETENGSTTVQILSSDPDGFILFDV